MKVLVILELSPEEVRKAIVDMTEEEYQVYSKAHNYTVNASDFNEDSEEAVLNALEKFCTKEEYISNLQAGNHEYCCNSWVDNKGLTDLTGADCLIHMGFIL